jgi:hypothetical protein
MTDQSGITVLQGDRFWLGSSRVDCVHYDRLTSLKRNVDWLIVRRSFNGFAAA